ncbi:hypothetical protein NZK32_12020 [Cyanobium sp. FGCU-52]|nr:hypothetical protein [Cyanobium sp. FGCU52]
MNAPRWSLLLAAVLAMPVPAPALALQPPASPGGGTDAEDAQWLARERGGGRRGGGGGNRRRGNHQARTGFGRTPRNLQRGNRRPSGGWSNRINADGGRRSLDRARRDWDRNRIADRGRRWDNVDRDRLRREFAGIDRNRIRDRVDRLERRDWDRDWDKVRDRYDWNDVRGDVRDAGRRLERTVNRWDDQWPGWVRPGWGLARPWGWGWYGAGVAPSWGWWGTRSVAWGLGSLATASVINAAVNQALADSRTTIVVPDTGYTLYYNSITSTGTDTISFSAGNGQTTWELTADCRQGWLNGGVPASAAQAQLLNAACQVAYGPADEAGDPGRNRTDTAPTSSSASGASPQRV